MEIDKKIIGFLYRLTQMKAFTKLLKKYDFQDPEEIIKAFNRFSGIIVSSADLSFNTVASVPSKSDHHLLRRICEAYILSKKNQPQSGPYAVHGMWESILQSKYQEMIQATEKKDIDRLASILNNAFRKGTYGLSMSGDLPSPEKSLTVESYLNNYVDNLLRLALFVNLPEIAKDMDNELYVFEAKYPIRTIWESICNRIAIDPSYPTDGNPFGMLYTSQYGTCAIPKTAFRHLHTAIRAIELIDADAKDSATIVEIGGGFGGVLYYLHKLSRRNTLLKSIDIPETNIISSYFLSKALPDVPIRFYGENPLPGSENTIQVMPNWTLKEIAPCSVSLVINSDSLPEMPAETMSEYLRNISTIAQYFFSINQDCGREHQNRLSQVNTEQLGLKCISYAVAWMRHGYFERVYRSTKNNKL